MGRPRKDAIKAIENVDEDNLDDEVEETEEQKNALIEQMLKEEEELLAAQNQEEGDPGDVVITVEKVVRALYSYVPGTDSWRANWPEFWAADMNVICKRIATYIQ